MPPLPVVLATAGRALLMLVLFVSAAVGTRYASSWWFTADTGSAVSAARQREVQTTGVRSSTAPAAVPTTPAAASSATAQPAPSPKAAPTLSATPKPVSAAAILRALQEQPLIDTSGLEGRPISGPAEYMTPGDTVESARLLGGVEYTIDTGPQNGVLASILMFEGQQDAKVELDGELVASEAGGAPFSRRSLAGTTVYCSQDSVVCTTAIGRAYIRVAGGDAQIDAPAVEPAIRAAISSLAAARAEAARDA